MATCNTLSARDSVLHPSWNVDVLKLWHEATRLMTKISSYPAPMNPCKLQHCSRSPLFIHSPEHFFSPVWSFLLSIWYFIVGWPLVRWVSYSLSVPSVPHTPCGPTAKALVGNTQWLQVQHAHFAHFALFNTMSSDDNGTFRTFLISPEHKVII